MTKESGWLLEPYEMLQPIWDMGVILEKQGKEPDQTDRFLTIAKTQAKKIAERQAKILENARGLVDAVAEIGDSVNEILKEIEES